MQYKYYYKFENNNLAHLHVNIGDAFPLLLNYLRIFVGY